MIKKYAPLLMSLYYGFRISCFLLFAGLTLVYFAGWEIPTALLVLFSILFSLIATLGDDRYFTAISYKIRRFLYPAILLLILIIMILKRYGEQDFISYCQTVIEWLIQNLNNQTGFILEHGLFVVFILYIVLSLLIKLCEKFFKVQVFLAFAVLVCLLTLGTCFIIFAPLAIFAGLFYILDTCITFSFKHLSSKKDVSTYCASLSVPFTIVLALLLLIPRAEGPIPYYRILHAIEQVGYSLSSIGQDVAGSLLDGVMGLGDKNVSLKGGNIAINDDEILRLYKNVRNYNPIYLTLNSSDYYTGQSWESTLVTPDSDYRCILDADEKMNHLTSVGFQRTDPMFHNISIKIQYRYIYTRSILYPDNCINIVDFAPLNTIVDKGSSLRMKKRPRLDSMYSVSSTEINMSSPEILDFLSKCTSFSDYALETAGVTEAFAPYLQLPELPDRVYALAQSLTEDCTYDYERVQKIVAYLRQMHYSTETRSYPQNQDAVDHFLFDEKEGYCIYYASAAAVLLRSIGIPSRFVQGVAIGEGEKVKSWFSVPATSSHAWCEAYIAGFGWTRFDSTPISRFTNYHNWPAVQNEDQEYYDTNPPFPYDQYLNHDDEAILNSDKSTKSHGKQEILLKYALLAVAILISIILILILINIFARRGRKKAFRNSSYDKQAVICYQDIIMHLSYFGFIKQDSETIKEFTDRIAEREANIFPRTIAVLYNFNDKRYSRDGFNKDDIDHFQDIIASLKAGFIERNSKFKYFLKTNLRI